MELGHTYIFEKPEQNICRVCLATESKLYYHILDSGLQNDFLNITGIQISLDDGLPQYICYICRGLLNKAIKFRNKSVSTQNILHLGRVMTNCNQVIFIKPLLPLTMTSTLIVNIPPVEPTETMDLLGNSSIKKENVEISEKQVETMDLLDNSSIKEENVEISENQVDLNNSEETFGKSEHQDNLNDTQSFVNPDINEHMFDADNVVDFEMGIDVTANATNESDKLEAVKESNVTKLVDGKAKLKAKTVKSSKFPNLNRGDPEIDAKTLKDSILSGNTDNFYAEKLYKYIISKYIDKTNKDTNIDETNDDYDLIDSEDESTQHNELLKVDDDSTEIQRTLTELTDVELSKKLLYEFMKVKYIEKKKPTKKRRRKTDRRLMQFQKRIEELKKTYDMDVKILSLDKQIAEMKERANTDKYKNSRFKCEQCFRGFQFEKAYKYHMRLHDSTLGTYKCEVCSHWFVKRHFLSRHQLQHKYRYICNECGVVSKVFYRALDHAKCHSGENVYKCEYCSKVFRKYATHMNHIRVKHGSVRCEICYDLMAPGGLIMHNSVRHKDTFVCPSCDKVFNDADALDVHTSQSKDGVCHPDDRPCAVCGESFASESKWMSHIEEHRIDRKRRQKRKSYWAVRGRRSRPQSSGRESDPGLGHTLMCEMCGDMQPSAAVMRDHQRIHTGERPFACTFCPKRFRLKGLLTIHINTHTGERPHKCPKCSKSFKSQAALYRHDLVHTKVRRHRCTLCDKTFQTSTSVKLHIKTVHLKMPMPPRVRNRKKREKSSDGEETC